MMVIVYARLELSYQGHGRLSSAGTQPPPKTMPTGFLQVALEIGGRPAVHLSFSLVHTGLFSGL
jgi:hypothetical protein